MWKHYSWKLKLPIIVGAVSILLSLPFIIGVLIPSIHEGNIYSALYVVLFMSIPINVIEKIVGSHSMSVYGDKSILGSNIMFIFAAILFYVLMAIIVGIFVDLLKYISNLHHK